MTVLHIVAYLLTFAFWRPASACFRIVPSDGERKRLHYRHTQPVECSSCKSWSSTNHWKQADLFICFAQTGAKFVSSMNAFHRLAYARLAGEQGSSTPQQGKSGHARQPSGNSAMSFNIAMRQGLDREFAAVPPTSA